MKILISSIGTATSINLIKYLKKMGHYIVGMDINKYGYTAGSLMVDAYETVPYAVEDSYIPKLKTIIESNNIDLFIPINDIEIDSIKNIVNTLGCKCIIPVPDIIKLFSNKKNSTEAIKQLGIDVPEELRQNTQNTKCIVRDFTGVGSKGIKVYEKNEPIPSFDASKQFIQKFVQGEEYTVDVLADKQGIPLYIVPRKRLEIKSGVATKTKIEKNDDLIEIVKTILEKYKLPGFSNIQFIKDENNRYWFVEVNYRFAGCGAATLISCKNYLQSFIDIVEDNISTYELNRDVEWNNIVLRYYEELVYNERLY